LVVLVKLARVTVEAAAGEHPQVRMLVVQRRRVALLTQMPLFCFASVVEQHSQGTLSTVYLHAFLALLLLTAHPFYKHHPPNITVLCRFAGAGAAGAGAGVVAAPQ
jgi:hypothetical protein